jgi:acetyltransferase-like isoleucine patch superfamily enzyme
MKSLAKTIARLLASLVAMPALAAYAVGSICTTPDAAFESTCQWLSLWPGMSGVYVRRAFLELTLPHCAATAHVGFGALLSKREAELGEHVYVGPRCHLGLVTLEDEVLLGPGVQIPSGPATHGVERLDIPFREQPGVIERVRIGRGAWIGAGAIVLADVGAQTVVGAGSVVTRPLPARVIAAGVPAKVIRQREENEIPEQTETIISLKINR